MRDVLEIDRDRLEDSNPHGAQTLVDRLAACSPLRRQLLGAGLGALLGRLGFGVGLGMTGGCAAPRGPAARTRLGFGSVALDGRDAVTVPEGYVVQVLFRWGDPVGVAGAMPQFRPDASNSAAEQALQGGMHHDGLHYFPLDGARRGLLCVNHEYVDDGLLHVGGQLPWTPEKVAKSQAAHGVSVIEIEARGDRFELVRPSRFARRITARTPCTISGPARGHRLVRTAADPEGLYVLGTLANCAHGATPWGTYLTCEENFRDYFRGPEAPSPHELRWGLRPRDAWYRWSEHDERFDATKHPHEPNRFGWVVEIDPFDPLSVPVKRTALGRAAHEGATVVHARDGRVVVYMGEDARGEHITKFVSRDPVRPGGYAANRDLLDHGTLHVARFDPDGTGEWVPLIAGRHGLTPDAGFADQGDVVVKARQAADRVGGTPMDRPEWIAHDATTGWLYCALTNNRDRGRMSALPVDAANPRANNLMGHILRWREDGDFTATRFRWEHFVLAGDPQAEQPEHRGTIYGDYFSSPDGLWVDPRGILWIQTDISTGSLGRNEHRRMPTNMMLACDPASGEIRRFLVGPHGCEVTGVVMTPDLRTMFVNIQHPGETPAYRSDPTHPARFSSWPDGAGMRPRSATIVIRRADGGVIGA